MGFCVDLGLRAFCFIWDWNIFINLINLEYFGSFGFGGFFETGKLYLIPGLRFLFIWDWDILLHLGFGDLLVPLGFGVF